MIPTSIDGTDITGATIDGQDVQEITVDGQTVFTATPPLPASAVNQYKFDEGSGSTAFDSIGSLDLNNNGMNYVSDADFVGGFSVEDNGSFFNGSRNPTLDRNNNFSFAVTIVPDAFSNNGCVVYNGDGSFNRFIMTTDAELVAGFTISNSRSDQVDQPMSDNERARIVFTWDGSTATLYKNKNGSTTNSSGSIIRRSNNATNAFQMGRADVSTTQYDGN